MAVNSKPYDWLWDEEDLIAEFKDLVVWVRSNEARADTHSSHHIMLNGHLELTNKRIVLVNQKKQIFVDEYRQKYGSVFQTSISYGKKNIEEQLHKFGTKNFEAFEKFSKLYPKVANKFNNKGYLGTTPKKYKLLMECGYQDNILFFSDIYQSELNGFSSNFLGFPKKKNGLMLEVINFNALFANASEILTKRNKMRRAKRLNKFITGKNTMELILTFNSPQNDIYIRDILSISQHIERMSLTKENYKTISINLIKNYLENYK